MKKILNDGVTLNQNTKTTKRGASLEQNSGKPKKNKTNWFLIIKQFKTLCDVFIWIKKAVYLTAFLIENIKKYFLLA